MKKVLAIGIVAILLLLLVPSVSATWCDNDYGKKAPILINNTGGSAQTYYQIELNFTHDSDMNSNFSDARIYNESDCSLIPLWNESAVPSSWNQIWFNATNIPASSWCNDTYYLYYDYSSASSVSNGSTTFEFFDDFLGGYANNYIQYDSNPVYDVAGMNAELGSIIKINATTYRMWYQHRIGATDVYDVRYVDSTDPKSFGTAAGTLALEKGASGKWDQDRLLTPWVINDSGTYRMYYVGVYDKDNPWVNSYRIGYAESTDGINFTKPNLGIITFNGSTNNSIVLDLGAGGQWDDSMVSCPGVIKVGSTYYMYYRGDASSADKRRIGVATSTDGKNFTRYASNPVLSKENTPEGGWNVGDAFSEPVPYYEDEVFYLFYYGQTSGSRIGMANSTDGINFTLYANNPILEDNGDGDPAGHCQPCYLAKFGTGDETYYLYWMWPTNLAFSPTIIPSSVRDSSVLDTDKWDFLEGTSYSVSDSNLTATAEADNFVRFATDANVSENGIVESRAQVNITGTNWYGLFLRSSGAYVNGIGAYHQGDGTVGLYDGGTLNSGNFDSPYNTWVRFTLKANETVANATINDATPISGTAVTTGVGKLSLQTSHNVVVKYDWVLIRKYASPEPTASLGTEESPSATYTPPNPTNLQHTDGNFWVNYTWSSGSGNVTNSYNVSNETAWINGSSNTYFNESLEASEWLNITVYAYNSSGGGTLSVGSVSDQQQAPSVSTKKFYETSTSDFSAEVAVIDLYTSRDGTANNVAYELATGNLYNYINATSNITVGNDIKIPAGTKVNFSAYFDDGDRVDAAYATWKFYRLVGTSTTLVCQKGDDSTGGVQIPDGTTETITGYCSVTSDVTLNSTDKVRLIMNVWAETIGGGGAATKVATHYWDSTHESWVEYKYQTTTTDTTFTVSLPVGYNKPVFEPPNSTATNYPPNGQTDSQEFFNVTNSGNVNLDVRMRLNTTVSTITLKADADNNPTGADTIGTSLVTIHSNLGQGSSVGVWLWSDFDHTPAQTANRTVYINVSQS